MSLIVTAIRLMVHSQRYQHLPESLTDCPEGWSFDHPFLGPITVRWQLGDKGVGVDIDGMIYHVSPADLDTTSRDLLHWWR